jgi:pimeloyl-ACP methyl ester carboxylesterase
MLRRDAVALIALAPALLRASAAHAAQLWETLPMPKPLPPPTASGYLRVNSIDLWYADYGGPHTFARPVILLHGGLANSEYWGNQVHALEQGYRVILMDSRGHGRSGRDARPYSYDLMADDVIGLMDALKIHRASVVGWSDGGIIGLDIAMRYPKRLHCLFAFGANSDPSGVRDDLSGSTTFNRFIAQAGEDYRRLSKTPGDYDAFVAAITEMWNAQPRWTTAQLHNIRSPVAIADGEHDEAIKREHTEKLARSIHYAQLIILHRVSHFAMLQDPALFNEKVLNFLETCALKYHLDWSNQNLRGWV